MKAKKLMGLIAFASACVSLSAFANTTNGWFGVTVSDTVVTVNISTNGVGVAESNAIKLTEVAQKTPLVFTPNADFEGTNRNDGIYVIGASVVLTPCSTNDFPAVPNAKAGVVAGIDDHDVTNYYGFAGGEWHPLTNATVVESGATDFCIVLNYRDDPKVAYFVISENDGDKWHGPYNMSAGTTALVDIKAWGTGSISSVTGGYEVAEAQFDGKKYGSVADAMAVAKEAAGSETPNYDSIAVVDNTGKVDPTPSTPDGNGLKKWENKAMGIESNAQVGLEKAAAKQNEGKITLAAILPNKEDGVVVGFKVKKDGELQEGLYAEDDIQIPMDSGTHTYEIVPFITTK